MKRFWVSQLPVLISVVALGAAAYALHGALREFHYHEVVTYIATIDAPTIAAALALAFLSLLATSSLDLVALRHLGRKVSLPVALVSSFVSTAVSNTASPAVVTGGALRFRLYSALGLTAEDIGVLVVFGGAGFWLGFVALAGAIFLVAAAPLPPSLGAGIVPLRMLGVCFVGAVIAYLVVCARGPRTVRLVRWEFPVPSLAIAITQVSVSALDWVLAAAALWMLAPDLRSVPFPAFLAVYLAAQAVGLASHVPGGLGVFEAVVVRVLAPHAPASDVLGALAAYRVVYYLIPLAVSLLSLGIIELRRTPVFEGVRSEAARWLAPSLPSLLSISTFIAGAVLLVSGATPGLSERMGSLDRYVPFAVIEASHLFASVTGAILLLLARGLQQRLSAAYVFSVVFLAAGVAFSLLKGLDYEEAVMLLVVLLALLPARQQFYRHSSILLERFTPGWITASLLVVGGSVAIGMFAFRHVEYSSELWWQFELNAHAPRFLRASLGASAIVTMGALSWLLRPVRRRPTRSAPADLDAAQAIVERLPDSSGHLALIGDKTLMFDRDRTAFVMYGVQGQTWVSLGDPVGPEDRRRELCWEFRELVDHEGGRTAFYDVPAESLPIYLEMGLALLKLGDQARVLLPAFTLDGKDRKEFRHLLNQAERAGTVFEVLPRERVPAIVDELRAISDDWLERKKTREKGFSLGFFDPEYLGRCPVAVVRHAGAAVAFANLWCGAPGGELSLDLMRYSDAAPASVMDYLFVQMILWGKAQGFGSLNLGMAPLSGLTDHALAPVWNRVGHLLYRRGEDFYNFQGVRQYKEKFDPVWEPRYLACAGGLGVARVLLDVASLNARGLGGLVAK